MPHCLQALPFIEKRLPKEILIQGGILECTTCGFLVSDILNERYRSKLSEVVLIWRDLQNAVKEPLRTGGSPYSMYSNDFPKLLKDYLIEAKQLTAFEKQLWQELNLYVEMTIRFSPFKEIMESRLVNVHFGLTWPSPIENKID
jgi:hypothetical protein